MNGNLNSIKELVMMMNAAETYIQGEDLRASILEKMGQEVALIFKNPYDYHPHAFARENICLTQRELSALMRAMCQGREADKSGI